MLTFQYILQNVSTCIRWIQVFVSIARCCLFKCFIFYFSPKEIKFSYYIINTLCSCAAGWLADWLYRLLLGTHCFELIKYTHWFVFKKANFIVMFWPYRSIVCTVEKNAKVHAFLIEFSTFPSNIAGFHY